MKPADPDDTHDLPPVAHRTLEEARAALRGIRRPTAPADAPRADDPLPTEGRADGRPTNELSRRPSTGQGDATGTGA